MPIASGANSSTRLRTSGWFTVPALTLRSGVPKHPDQPLGEQEVLDRDPVHAAPKSPGSERFGRVVGPDHEAGPDPVCGGDSARLPMKADHLDSVTDRLPPKPLAEHLGGAAGKGRVGVRLDLELEADCLPAPGRSAPRVGAGAPPSALPRSHG